MANAGSNKTILPNVQNFTMESGLLLLPQVTHLIWLVGIIENVIDLTETKLTFQKVEIPVTVLGLSWTGMWV